MNTPNNCTYCRNTLYGKKPALNSVKNPTFSSLENDTLIINLQYPSCTGLL